MTEEVLKSLAQLFAILTKQDGGATSAERSYVASAFNKRITQEAANTYLLLYDQYVQQALDQETESTIITTSVKDSILTLQVCKRINKVLTHKQKIIVIVELFELVKADGKFTWQRKHILDAISKAFNIDQAEYTMLQNFVLQDDISAAAYKNLVCLDELGTPLVFDFSKTSSALPSKERISFIKIKSANFLFFKHNFSDTPTLNGAAVSAKSIALLPQGFSIKHPNGSVIFYSDVDSQFRKHTFTPMQFVVKDLYYHFSKKIVGLKDIRFSENAGNLVAIMGSSGSGKTTLLSVLAGIISPSRGQVTLNGIDIHHNRSHVSPAIGYISQDDLLIEELTVFQNLYYNTRLSFPNLTTQEIEQLVTTTLDHLGLLVVQDLQVGNVFDKTISGGQRKRLNIALELIREPSILFVDEPTSGLSSSDSENVIDLLKELSFKGKLIFVVIHQPSSEIFRLFDKLLLLDNGGYLIYYGDPVESISYLKNNSKHINQDSSQCIACGNINPEQIFNITEEKIVNEFGHPTEYRKITAAQWAEKFHKHRKESTKSENHEPLKAIKHAPSRWVQWRVFATRDILSKFRNKQYLLINLLEAPLLALALAFLLRYNNNTTFTRYTFRFNDNLPAYILMSIIVAIFMGLCVSAEEIIRDKKILKREALLDLSRSSYLLSKLFILFTLSAIQTLLFVFVGNSILEIQGLTLQYWLILFSVSCMANIIGLVISSSFNSVVTVYILIPLLLIPQMVLSGGLLSFEKINDNLNNKDKVPVAADMFGSRWAFEALAVAQFKQNNYGKLFYEIEQVEAIANFNLVYILPDLNARLHHLKTHYHMRDSLSALKTFENLEVLRNELIKQRHINPEISIEWMRDLDPAKLKQEDMLRLKQYMADLSNNYSDIFLHFQKRKDHMTYQYEQQHAEGINKLKDQYYNESIADMVRNIHTKYRLLEIDSRLVPKLESIFFNPTHEPEMLDFRTHFFSPTKLFLGFSIDTFLFNLIVIWMISLCTYVLLYFDAMKKIIVYLSQVKYHRE